MKREPLWVKLFLRELAATGNVRISAERAGVDFSSAYQRRKRHGEFAERWEGALSVFALRRAQDEREGAPSPGSPAASPASGQAMPPAWPSAAASPARGEELVRPDGKVIKGSEARWGKRVEEAFLAELTLSANVRHSAKAAGFSTQAVYKRRLKDRHFAAAWDAAIEVGKASVQAYLVEAAKRTFDPDELPIGDGREISKVSIAEAINIAKLRAAGPAPLADEAENYDEDYLREVRERILEKLRRLRERDLRELGEAGWVEWDLPARPEGGDGGTVWLPPDYRLVREEDARQPNAER